MKRIQITYRYTSNEDIHYVILTKSQAIFSLCAIYPTTTTCHHGKGWPAVVSIRRKNKKTTRKIPNDILNMKCRRNNINTWTRPIIFKTRCTRSPAIPCPLPPWPRWPVAVVIAGNSLNSRYTLHDILADKGKRKHARITWLSSEPIHYSRRDKWGRRGLTGEEEETVAGTMQAWTVPAQTPVLLWPGTSCCVGGRNPHYRRSFGWPCWALRQKRNRRSSPEKGLVGAGTEGGGWKDRKSATKVNAASGTPRDSSAGVGGAVVCSPKQNGGSRSSEAWSSSCGAARVAGNLTKKNTGGGYGIFAKKKLQPVLDHRPMYYFQYIASRSLHYQDYLFRDWGNCKRHPYDL